MHGANFTVSKI